MTAKMFKALVAAAVCAVSQAAVAAPVTWAGNGHEYEFITITAPNITWTAANTAANALAGGWYLATATSSAEEAFIESLLPTSPPNRTHVWLGGTLSSGTWGSWVTGEAWGFTDWWGSEPNGGAGEPYLALDFRIPAGAAGSWAWNDVPNDIPAIHGCCAAIGYVIERAPEQPAPEPGTLALLGLGLAGLAASRRRKQ